MHRTITYKGIKSIVYEIFEDDLNKIILSAIRKDDLFVSSKFPTKWNYEWCETENGMVYIQVTCEITEKKEKP